MDTAYYTNQVPYLDDKWLRNKSDGSALLMQE